METKKSIYDYLLIISIVAIIVIIFVSLFRSCEITEPSLIKRYESENDSLANIVKNSKMKIVEYDNEIKELYANLLIAQNDSQISETKYFALKNKKVKPIYIESIIDCNDTVQSLYKYSIVKDSLCKVAILDKNKVISVQDSTYKHQEKENKELKGIVLKEEVQNKNLNEIITIEQKEVRKEKLNKNIYKLTTLGLAGLILKILLFR